MNYMNEIAKLLDIKMGEEFKVVEAIGEPRDCIFKLTENGLKSIRIESNGDYLGGWIGDPYVLSLLLTGKCSIVKIPWKPKKGDVFYAIYLNSNNEINVYDYKWDDTSDCDEYYALGNCFLTREDAEKHKDKYAKWIRNGGTDTSWREQP